MNPDLVGMLRDARRTPSIVGDRIQFLEAPRIRDLAVEARTIELAKTDIVGELEVR